MGWHKIPRDLRVAGVIRASSGLTLDAGGITVTAGGITATAGVITQTVGNPVITAGGVDLPVETQTSTTPSLLNYGLSIMSNSSAVITATLAAPTAGVEKFVEIVGGSSSIAHVLKASSAGAVTFGGTDFIMTVSTAGNGSIGLHLIGATTARWGIMGSYGTLTGSTS